MYESLKNIFFSFIPKKWIKKNELFFRRFLYVFYRGHRYYCPICSARLSKFIHIKTGDLVCPRCGSLPRQRRLWLQMQSTLSLPTRILHFSPPKGLKRALRAIKHLDYMTSDYKGEFESDIVLDLTKATPGLAPFDLIFCYHVLEHIEDDKRAMDTMFQLLKPGGHLWVQTPFTEGELQEDFSIQAPHDREKYFGQVDHVRIYSVDVLKSRLEKAGFEVELKLFESGSDNPAGLLETETVILASKKNEL